MLCDSWNEGREHVPWQRGMCSSLALCRCVAFCLYSTCYRGCVPRILRAIIQTMISFLHIFLCLCFTRSTIIMFRFAFCFSFKNIKLSICFFV